MSLKPSPPAVPNSPLSRRVWWCAVAGSLGVLVVVWLLTIPLGIPGEWTWNRAEPVPAYLLALVVPAITAAGFVWLVYRGGLRIGDGGRWERTGWLLSLTAASGVWLWVIQESAPIAFQLSKGAWVLYYPGPSGYFTEARKSTDDWRTFLGEYDRRMQGEVLHLGTHPPGLILGFRALRSVCEQSEGLCRLIRSTEPDSAREAFNVIAQNARRAGGGQATPPLTPADEATLWLAAVLVLMIASATILPLYALLRCWFTPTASWQATAFWPTVPALAIFWPKSDLLLPAVGLLFLALWMQGWRRRSVVLGLLAGAVLWLGLFISLAMLPVILLAGLVTLTAEWAEWSAARPAGTAAGRFSDCGRKVSVLAAAGFGVLLPCLLLWGLSGLNLPRVWWTSYQNHAAFYAQFQRTYWKWLLVNPIELAVAVGVPLAVAAVAGLGSLWSARRGERHSSLAQFCGGVVVTWGLLWLSGKNSGEVARLWIVFMPWLIVLATPTITGELPGVTLSTTGASPPANSPTAAAGVATGATADSRWLKLLALQFVVNIGLVTRVVGFHIP